MFIAQDAKEDKDYNYCYLHCQHHVYHIISDRCTYCTISIDHHSWLIHMFLIVISSPLLRYISHKNYFYYFFYSREHPGTYIILSVGVRSEHTIQRWRNYILMTLCVIFFFLEAPPTLVLWHLTNLNTYLYVYIVFGSVAPYCGKSEKGGS